MGPLFFQAIPATRLMSVRIRPCMTRIPHSISSFGNRTRQVDESSLVMEVLYRRQGAAIERHGSTSFLRALNALEPHFTPASEEACSQLADRLERLSGWRMVAVSPSAAAEVNWSALAHKELRISQNVRRRHELDCIMANDWFAGAFGRLPALLIPDFSHLLQRLGQIGHAVQADGEALAQLHRIYDHLTERALVIDIDGVGRESPPRLFGASLVSHFPSVREFDPHDPRWKSYSLEALTAPETRTDARFIVHSWKEVRADLDRWFRGWQSTQRPNPESHETAQCSASAPQRSF